MLELGLLLPVLVTGVLGVAYFKALASRERAVEAAGRQIAQRIGDRARAIASARGDEAAGAILKPVSRIQPFDVPLAFKAMQAATDSLRACGCGPLKEGAYFFAWVPGTGTFMASAVGAGQPEWRKRVPATVPHRPRGEAGIWAMGGGDARHPWLIHYTVVRGPGGAETVMGFDISMTSLWASAIAPGIEVARREFFPMIADPDTAFSAVLLVADHEVARSGPHYDGPSARTALLGDDYFTLDIALNPAILPVFLSAAAPPNYPLLLGALGAALVASILALLLLGQLRRTTARREAFVASITHELRTPLTEVLLHAETLALDRQTPEAKGRAAGAIVRETRRLIGLVENALTVAGAGRVGAVAGPPHAVPLAPLVRASLEALASAAAQRQSRLVADLDESASSIIDPVSVDRIVTNLVDNALRYGPVGQMIRVSLLRETGLVRLTVEDEGPGVEDRDQARIWNPFERGTAARSSPATGVGLGLAIVKHLSEAVGGTAIVTSTSNGGARFTVSIPATPEVPPT